ncbi:MAG: phage integrase SAM-like domain-containing protein [Bacteroidota bacterium]|nr:phage integrase SAM-like domain-containing protein [Bacteroidota bacterium]
MSCSFFLNQPRAIEKTKIQMVFSFPGDRCRILLNYAINPKNWDKKRQKIKNDIAGNEFLKNAESVVTEIYEELIKEKLFSIETLKARFSMVDILNNQQNRVLEKRKPKSEIIDFEQFFDLFKEEMKHEYASNTLKKYETCCSLIKRYEADRGIKLRFSDINLEFGRNWIQWMMGQKGKYLIDGEATPMLRNTISKNLQILKTLMSWAEEKRLHTNGDYRKIKYAPESNKTDIVSLTDEEEKKLFNYKPKSRHLKTTQDIAFILIQTGVSYIDLKKINKTNLVEEKEGMYFDINREKTGISSGPPCSAKLYKLLKSYNFSTPIMHSQNFNENFKMLCKLAGIDAEVQIRKNNDLSSMDKGNVVLSGPKWMFMSSRRLRQSFITKHANNPDIPFVGVMSMAGQIKPGTTMRYVKVDMNAVLKGLNKK